MVRGNQGFIRTGSRVGGGGGQILGGCLGSEVSPISGGVGVPTSFFIVP